MVCASGGSGSDDAAELARLEGEIPSPINPPPGCHFHPRCPVYNRASSFDDLQEKCPAFYPDLENKGGHYVACFAVFAKNL